MLLGRGKHFPCNLQYPDVVGKWKEIPLKAPAHTALNDSSGKTLRKDGI